jgi:DNA-binding FadR family transcriptional regulator
MWPDQLPARGRRRHVDVAEAIASAIASGQLAPGSRLPSDRELAATLGVSRPTAREGLLALQYAGLIEVRQGSGAYVNQRPNGPGALALSGADEPEKLIEARVAVEPAIAQLCAATVNDEMTRLLDDMIERAEREARPEGSPMELVRLGLEFHRALASQCGNPFLAGFCASLVSVTDHPLWMLLNRQAMLTVEARRRQVQEHRVIKEAVVAGNPEAAFHAMKTHLEGVSASISSLV